MYLWNRPAVIGRRLNITLLTMKRRLYWFFFFPSWCSDFKKLSVWPLVNEVKGITWEKAVLVLYYYYYFFFLLALSILFWPGALFSLLKKNYWFKTTKGVAMGPRENQQGPNCLELQARISSEKKSSWDHQIGVELGFQKTISLKI